MAATDQLAQLAAQYGWAWAVFNSNPELMNLLRQAVKGTNGVSWEGTKFGAEVMNTKWYRTQSAATRDWLVLKEGDPATAAARAKARQTTIQNTAGALGVALSAAQLADITNQSLLLGWTDAQVQQAIGKDWVYNPKVAQAGLAAQSVNAMRKAAYDYLVPISDQTIQQWGGRVEQGAATAADFTAYAQNQAASLFPGWEKEIRAGATVQQLADPYKQLAAQTLGIDPNAIDLTDPKYRKAIDQVDPKSGQHSVMSLADWQNTLRQDSAYGYDATSGARAQAADLATKLAQSFGAQ